MATVKTASSSRYQEKDVDGFDREADTVGAGIYRERQARRKWKCYYGEAIPKP